MCLPPLNDEAFVALLPSKDAILENNILPLGVCDALKVQIKEFVVLLVSSLHCRAAHCPASR